jgi:hypothetical protein
MNKRKTPIDFKYADRKKTARREGFLKKQARSIMPDELMNVRV